MLLKCYVTWMSCYLNVMLQYLNVMLLKCFTQVWVALQLGGVAGAGAGGFQAVWVWAGAGGFQAVRAAGGLARQLLELRWVIR